MKSENKNSQNLYNSNKYFSKNKNSSNPPTFLYDVTLKNIRSFGQQLISVLNPIGEGSFGQVFEYDYNFGKKSMKVQRLAMKLFQIKGISALNQKNNEQDNLLSEIMVNKKLNSMDPENFFFPKFFKCYEISEYLKELGNTSMNLSHKREAYLEVAKGKLAVTLMSERLQLSLSSLFLALKNKSIQPIPILTRIKMGMYLVRGLQVMNKQFIHCDINPNNIMIRKARKSKIQKLISHKLPLINLSPNEYYEMKYIDFGTSELIDKTSSKLTLCKTGTPGFIPNDFFNKNTSHTKFDTYSLGMSLLDLELMSLKGYRYSELEEKIFAQKKKGESVFTQKQISSLKKKRLVKNFEKLIDDHRFKNFFREEVIKVFPSIKQMLSKMSPPIDFDTATPSSYYFSSLLIFQRMSGAALKIYIQHSHDFDDPLDAQEAQRITQIDDSLLDSTLSKLSQSLLKSEREYLEARIALRKEDVHLNKMYLKLISLMMAYSPALRKPIDVIYTEMKQLIDGYVDKHVDLIEIIESYQMDIAEEESSFLDVKELNEVMFNKNLFQSSEKSNYLII